MMQQHELARKYLSFPRVKGQVLSNSEFKNVTYGSELVIGTDSDMSGPNNWSNVNLGVLDINSTVAGKMYAEGNGGHDYTLLSNTFPTVNRYYLLSIKHRLNTGSAVQIGLGSSFGEPRGISYTPTSAETNSTGMILANSNTLYIGAFTPGFNGVGYEIDDVSAKLATLDSWSEVGTKDATSYIFFVNDQLRIVSDGDEMGVAQNVINGFYTYELKIASVSSGSLKITDGITDFETFSSAGRYVGSLRAADSAINLIRNAACDITVDYFRLFST